MNIDKMTDEEVQPAIEPYASEDWTYWKTRSEIYARNFEESQNVLKATNAALEEWKRLAGVYEQEARILDSDHRDQMEITGRKEMELTKLRGALRAMIATSKETRCNCFDEEGNSICDYCERANDSLIAAELMVAESKP